MRRQTGFGLTCDESREAGAAGAKWMPAPDLLMPRPPYTFAHDDTCVAEQRDGADGEEGGSVRATGVKLGLSVPGDPGPLELHVRKARPADQPCETRASCSQVIPRGWRVLSAAHDLQYERELRWRCACVSLSGPSVLWCLAYRCGVAPVLCRGAGGLGWGGVTPIFAGNGPYLRLPHECTPGSPLCEHGPGPGHRRIPVPTQGRGMAMAPTHPNQSVWPLHSEAQRVDGQVSPACPSPSLLDFPHTHTQWDQGLVT